MESRSPNGNGGGGEEGHHLLPPLQTAPPGDTLDDRRLQPAAAAPRAQEAPSPGPGVTARPPPSAPQVLSLDQIRAARCSNEYTEGPTAAQKSPVAQIDDNVPSPVPTQRAGDDRRETQEERPNNLRNSIPVRPQAAGDSSQNSARYSAGSASSVQRLVDSGDEIIRTQPKRAELNCDELKPLHVVSGTAAASATLKKGGGGGAEGKKHSQRCAECGRCRCRECVRPRALPSRWLCGRRCVCSPQNAVEYGTCVCCVKGLFYHCSSDDEDTCADKPFSCATQSHCCARWTAVSLLALLFPCILCYLPAKAGLVACQCCYDRATRPGCRCKNVTMVHDKPVT